MILILCAFLIVWFYNAYDHPDPFFTYLGLFLIDIISCGGSGASIHEFKSPKVRHILRNFKQFFLQCVDSLYEGHRLRFNLSIVRVPCGLHLFTIH